MKHKTEKLMAGIAKKMRSEAVKYSKKNPKLKAMLKDFKYHFKKNKWPLSYLSHLEKSECAEIAFNAFLEINGYKLKYSKKYLRLYIVKA
jgi:hypothetical protein